MTKILSRRSLLGSAAIGTVALFLAACSEQKPEGEAKAPEPVKAAEPAAAPAEPAKTETTPAASEPAKTEAAATEPAKPTTAVEIPEAAGEVDVAKLMEPGKLKDIFIGNADAKVTIVEYASMTCPHCAAFHNATLPAIKEKYIDTGKARLVLREFPFDPRAAAAFMLSRCAGDDKYYAMVGALFQQQEVWSRAEDAKAALLQLSKLAGFTQDSFDACLTNQQLLNDVNAVRERGEKDFGVESTPTFFINGKKYPGALTVEQMSGVIDALL
ncbi:MAG: DsbA family protein [Rhizobiaceae bacterium]